MRTKHCYPYQELIHRWIHSPEMVYSSRTCYLYGIGNYLLKNNFTSKPSIEDIENNYYWYRYNIIAIIDRDNKQILIKEDDSKYNIDNIIKNSCPSNYTIYHCDENIPSYDILDFNNKDNKETLYRLHISYAIRLYCEQILYPFYAVLNGKRALHSNIDNLDDVDYHNWYSISSLIAFVKHNKIKQYSWYSKSIKDKPVPITIYYPKYWNCASIVLPSIKQIITNTIFTEQQIDLFRKVYFYTNYCRGYGISFKDVNKYWHCCFNKEDIKKYLDKRNNYWLNEYTDRDVDTWNNYIIRNNEIQVTHRKNYIDKAYEESKQNKLNAKKILQDRNNITINSWREGKSFVDRESYRQFVRSNSKNVYGRWVNQYVYNNVNYFINTQLRLDGKYIITSRHAKVKLDTGIKLWNYFIKCITDNPNKIDFTNPGMYIDIYPFEHISYLEKYKDVTMEKLGYMSWCIKVGCHNLWLEEILDFIKYYHLEDKFNVKPFINQYNNINYETNK